MGQEERLSRRKVVNYATKAVEAVTECEAKVVECVTAVNNQASRLGEFTGKAFTDFQITTNRRFTAYTQKVEDLDRRLTDADVETLRLLHDFLHMPFYRRWAWTLFGYYRPPIVTTGRSMVAGETPVPPKKAHETPRPVRPVYETSQPAWPHRGAPQ